MKSILLEELQGRWLRCRTLLQAQVPGAAGLLVFSRLNIYYLSGTFAKGIFWLPLQGEPLLCCRRGVERARLESAVSDLVEYRSYGDLRRYLLDRGVEPGTRLAVEMQGLSWALGQSLSKYLADFSLIAGDRVVGLARSVKSSWELDRMRETGRRHAACLEQALPGVLAAGMTELEIGRALWDVSLAAGHQSLLRMENYGEEVSLGHIAAGESANYPSVFNGPVGLRGMHPAVPHLGSGEIVWREGEPLVCDTGFMLEGYQTDKTQVYWLGNRESIPARVRAAHAFCLELQDWLAARLRPGVLPAELWAASLARAEQAGWAEGFMALGGNKVAFVGHGIGLAIDEYPVLAPGFEAPLENGMVLAIEPKIGLAGVGMVGVENTFEVTSEGGRSLTGREREILCIAP